MKDEYPYSEWDDLKFTLWGGFVLLLPLGFIALVLYLVLRHL